MIDNKVKNRIIGIEKIPASVDEDFHDSTILYREVLLFDFSDWRIETEPH